MAPLHNFEPLRSTYGHHYAKILIFEVKPISYNLLRTTKIMTISSATTKIAGMTPLNLLEKGFGSDSRENIKLQNNEIILNRNLEFICKFMLYFLQLKT